MLTLKQLCGKFLLCIMIVGAIAACQTRPNQWPANGTSIHSVTYHIPVEDSSKILIDNGEFFTLGAFADSLQTATDIITYAAPEITEYTKIIGDIAQQAVRQSDSNTVEYFRFDNGNVYFPAFITRNKEQPLTIFEPPLLLRPAVFTEHATSTSFMKTWNSETMTFNEGLKTVVSIQKKRDIVMRDAGGRSRTCTLVYMTMTQDATVAYGENNLALPEAIVRKQYVLIDQQSGIIAEWGIKNTTVQQDEEERPLKQPELFIELTIYEE